MTLLIFDQWEEGVDIYTDTLVTTEDHEPSGHAMKVWTLPHIRMAMVVTGTAELGELWSQQIRTSYGLRDIIDVDLNAPHALNSIHAHLSEHLGDIKTSTVYHFGFPNGSDKLVRYTYRSTKHYQSEPSAPGHAYAFKPQPAAPLHRAQSDDEVIEHALRIRDDHASGASAERIPIGGQLMRTRLTPEGIAVGSVHDFPNDGTDWRKR